MPFPPLELTHELRLRRWARQNHVPPAERDSNWHPVILEEMWQRDRDIQAGSTNEAEELEGSAGRVHRSHTLRAARFLGRQSHQAGSRVVAGTFE